MRRKINCTKVWLLAEKFETRVKKCFVSNVTILQMCEVCQPMFKYLKCFF